MVETSFPLFSLCTAVDVGTCTARKSARAIPAGDRSDRQRRPPTGTARSGGWTGPPAVDGDAPGSAEDWGQLIDGADVAIAERCSAGETPWLVGQPLGEIVAGDVRDPSADREALREGSPDHGDGAGRRQ